MRTDEEWLEENNCRPHFQSYNNNEYICATSLKRDDSKINFY
jgi:hypothetical protein